MAASVDQKNRDNYQCSRICIVEHGQRALTVGVANVLVQQGFDVTLLSVGASDADAADHLLEDAVVREQLTVPDAVFVQLPYAARQSYLAYLYLRDRAFDVIQFPSSSGLGYYTQLAQRQGLALRDTRVVVHLECPEYWHLQHGGRLIDDVMVLDRMFMERRSTEIADQLVSQSADMLVWMRSHDWNVPQASCAIDDFHDQGSDNDTECSRQRVEANWLELYRRLVVQGAADIVDSDVSDAPLVSVCLVHFNRPQLLSFMIDSLCGQDYTNFEVILVDDGSTLPAATDYLEALEPLFAGRGWRIVHQQNAYLGAARNNAAAHASGEYLLFLDDDNVATEKMISTLAGVMQRRNVDILTCATNVFEGDGAPPENVATGTHWVPLGASVASGLFRNVFGDASALIRKSTFDRLGGFSEDYGLGHEDWEFYARAVLDGYQLEVVPEPLLFYRVRGGGMLLSGNTDASLARSLRPYLDAVPAELQPVLYLALGQEHARHAAPAGMFSPSVLLGLIKAFAGSGGKRGMLTRFIRVVRNQGWSRAIKAALRYGKQEI